MKVYVIALDDDKEPKPMLYIEKGGVRQFLQPVIIPELEEALKRLRSWLDDVYNAITNWLSGVSSSAPSLAGPCWASMLALPSLRESQASMWSTTRL